MAQPLAPAAVPPVRTLTQFEQGIIDAFVRLAGMLGIPKSVGEIYGLLFASARPLPFQEIIELLDMSKGSGSQGLRLLRGIGAIKVMYVACDRRDHFLPETELRALLSGFLREKIQPHLAGGGLRIKALQAMARSSDLGVDTPAESRVLRDRIDKLYAWHKRGKASVPVVMRILG